MRKGTTQKSPGQTSPTRATQPAPPAEAPESTNQTFPRDTSPEENSEELKVTQDTKLPIADPTVDPIVDPVPPRKLRTLNFNKDYGTISGDCGYAYEQDGAHFDAEGNEVVE